MNLLEIDNAQLWDQDASSRRDSYQVLMGQLLQGLPQWGSTAAQEARKVVFTYYRSGS